MNFIYSQQMKRKLDDVARKLEMLYDAIRENKVSFKYVKKKYRNEWSEPILNIGLPICSYRRIH